MTNEILNNVKDLFDKAIAHLKEEFAGLQAGKANPAMVENILVDVYGQKMRMKEVGSISTPEPQQILISPWDKSVLGSVEKAIRDSDLGLSPMNEGGAVRIQIPHLTEERRRDMVKVVHSKSEDAKISIRQNRQDAKSKLEKLEKDKQISEDELRDAESDLQDAVNDANKSVEEHMKKKEESIMTV